MLKELIITLIILVIIGRLLVWYCKPLLPRMLSDGALKGDAKTMKFPKGFSFGAATAAWQIEKDVEPSNWTIFETKMRKDGKTPCAPPHLDACDAIAHFDEDLETIKSMNMTSYRFGVSWSALNPEDGKFDKEYLKHYVDMCKKLKANGIEPMITLCHFEIPAWLDEIGGVVADEFKDKFNAFVEFVVTELRDYCQYWFTINEPAVWSMMGWLFGEFAPGHSSWSEYKKALITFMEAHVEAYKLIHKLSPNAKVGFAKQIILFLPIHKSSGLEHLIAYAGNRFFNYPVMESLVTGKVEMSFFGIKLFSRKIEGLTESVDFIGINHYTAIFASYNPLDWSGRKECPVILSNYTRRFEMSDFGWTLAPETLAITMSWVNKRWNPKKLPMIVSEHGIANEDDSQRRWFTMDSLEYLNKAIREENLPVTHYLHWSLIDNYEWADGYTQHFGLVAVDLKTQERTPRETCKLVASVAANTNNQ